MSALHNERGMWPGAWWACAHPERPADDNTWYSETCRACVLALGAIAHHEPARPMVSEQTGIAVTAHDAYERYRGPYMLPSLP